MPDTQGKFYKKLYGKIGEKKAEKYLKDLGYKFVARNYRTCFAEADLIFYDDEILVFVEVKSRSSAEYGVPSQAVNAKKREKYFLLAQYYLQKIKKEVEVRFDVVEVQNGEINHIKDAFRG